MTSNASHLVVYGVIINKSRVPRPNLTVKAFDRNVGLDDTLLGQSDTDNQGKYSITYSSEQLGGKDAADMLICVYNGNILLQISDVIFNASNATIKDFVIPDENPTFKRLAAKIQPLLRAIDLLGRPRVVSS